MLLVGVEANYLGPGLTIREARSHFSLWCIMASPLLASNDIRSMSEDIRSILTNKYAIMVNQDPLGIQGRTIDWNNLFQLISTWIKPLSGGNYAVLLLNADANDQNVTLNFNDITNVDSWNVFDIWQNKNVGRFSKSYTTYIQKRDVTFLILSK
jgi:alpha-galactosidase